MWWLLSYDWYDKWSSSLHGAALVVPGAKQLVRCWWSRQDLDVSLHMLLLSSTSNGFCLALYTLMPLQSIKVLRSKFSGLPFINAMWTSMGAGITTYWHNFIYSCVFSFPLGLSASEQVWDQGPWQPLTSVMNWQSEEGLQSAVPAANVNCPFKSPGLKCNQRIATE